MKFGRKKEIFYYAGQEIPQQKLDRYRCLDAATRGVLKKAQARTGVIIGFLIVAFGLILGKLFFLTVMHYEARSFKPSVLKTTVAFKRQNILDRNGMVLATSIPTHDLSVNPRKIKNPERTAADLVKAMPDLNYDDVLAKFKSPRAFQYIKRNITPAESNALLSVGSPYLEETNNEKRAYPQGSLFSHILGAVDLDNVGTEGLEKAYEEELKEKDVQLSLDIVVQGIVHQVLTERIKKYQAIGGFSIVMNVNNGEILAMVSLPDYDPEQPSTDETMEYRFKKATLGTYEFGSVFKLFNTALALESGDIKVTDSVDAIRGSLKIPLGKGRVKVIEDFNGGQNRWLTVPEVLMHSSNIGSARIALKAGWQKQKAFFERMGFYGRLDINLPELGRSRGPREAKWSEITSATAAYGYGVMVTPLHLVAAVAALANGGYYRVPTFIKGGNDGKHEVKVLSKEVSDKMRHLMWAVVNWDIKKNSPISRYAVGGKTGTADMMN